MMDILGVNGVVRGEIWYLFDIFEIAIIFIVIFLCLGLQISGRSINIDLL